MLEPVLPDDWLDISLNHQPSGLDAPWKLACIELLRKRGEESLAFPDVQSLVVVATGLRTNWAVRPSEHLNRIPEFEWAIETAWSEPGRTPFKHSSVWHAMQEVRAIDAELDELIKLNEWGWQPTCDDRREGQPDWLVRRNDVELPVEVKSKGDASAAEDYLKGAFNALLLLDLARGFRRIDWHFSSSANATATELLGADPKALELTVNQMFELRRSISDWLVENFPSSNTKSWSGSDGVTILIECWDDSLEFTVRETTTGAEFKFTGELRDGPWRYSRFQTWVGWELDRLTHEQVDSIAKMLGKTLKENQLDSFPSDALYFIRWHAPLFWERAFRRYPQDTTAIAERIVESKSCTSVAIWISSLRSDHVIPNTPASEHFASD